MSLGLDIIGADYGEILSTVFQAAGGIVDYAKAAQAEKDAAAGVDSALAAAIAADQAATNAIAKASMSALVAKGDPSKAGVVAADKAAAANALAVQDTAGAALPEEKRGERVKVAQEAVDNATKKVQAASGNAKAVAQLQLNAAKHTLAKAKGIVEKIDKQGDDESGFFSKKLVGPFRVGHAAAVVAAGVIVGVLAAVFKKSHK